MATAFQWHTSSENTRLAKRFDTQIRQKPNKIPETLRDLHQDNRGHARYIFIDILLSVILETENEDSASLATMSMFHTMCATGLPTTLLNILLDSRVYIWDDSSEFYHPDLLVSDLIPYRVYRLLTCIFSNTP